MIFQQGVFIRCKDMKKHQSDETPCRIFVGYYL